MNAAATLPVFLQSAMTTGQLALGQVLWDTVTNPWGSSYQGPGVLSQGPSPFYNLYSPYSTFAQTPDYSLLSSNGFQSLPAVARTVPEISLLQRQGNIRLDNETLASLALLESATSLAEKQAVARAQQQAQRTATTTTTALTPSPAPGPFHRIGFGSFGMDAVNHQPVEVLEVRVPLIIKPDQHDVDSLSLLGRRPTELTRLSVTGMLSADTTTQLPAVPKASAEVLSVSNTGVLADDAGSVLSSQAEDAGSVLIANDPTRVPVELQEIIYNIVNTQPMQAKGLEGTPEGEKFAMMMLYAQMAKQPLVAALQVLQKYSLDPESITTGEARTEIKQALATLGFQSSMVGQLGLNFRPTEFLAFVSEVVLSRKGKMVIEATVAEVAKTAIVLLDNGALPSNDVLGRQHTGANNRLMPDEAEDTDARIGASSGSAGASNQQAN